MLPTNNNNRASHRVAQTFALVGLMSASFLPPVSKTTRASIHHSRDGSLSAVLTKREAIRNDLDPICSDSLNLDSDLPTTNERLPIFLSHVGSLKDIRVAARKCQGKGGVLARRFHYLTAAHHS